MKHFNLVRIIFASVLALSTLFASVNAQTYSLDPLAWAVPVDKRPPNFGTPRI